MKPCLFVTQPLFPENEALLAQHFDIRLNEVDSRVITEQELIDGLKGCSWLFCRLGDPVSRAVLEASPTLRRIHTMATRPDHIDMETVTRLGIEVIPRQNDYPGLPCADNTPDTAELCLALMLAVTRGVVAADKNLRKGQFPGAQSGRYAGPTLFGAKLGLIGMGPVAREVLKRAVGFGVHPAYWSRSRKEDVEAEFGAVWKPLPQLLAESDMVSLHIRESADTRHFMNAERFGLMKPGAIFINTSRGGLVDSEALYTVLRSGKLYGAALDVFEDEPSPTFPQDIQLSPRLVLTPHLGSAVRSKRIIMEKGVCVDMVTRLRGE